MTGQEWLGVLIWAALVLSITRWLLTAPYNPTRLRKSRGSHVRREINRN